MSRPQNLIDAIECHKSFSDRSITSIYAEFHVSETTLCRHLAKLNTTCRRGPNPIFTPKEEEAITIHIHHFIQHGLSFTRRDLIAIGIRVLLKKKEQPGNEELPSKLGKKWAQAFFKRHPHFILKKGERTDPERFMMSQDRLENWFEKYQKV